MGRYVVGAYAASPCTESWDAARESALWDGLDAAGFVGGLELPFSGALHAHDVDWLLRSVRPHWSVVLTCIPGTMERLARDPEFGLASSSEAGRGRALEFAAAAREAVVQLEQGLRRQAVVAVEIHSAPRPVPSAEPLSDAFRRSLDVLRGWDWRGAALSVEHCDAFVPGQAPAKGFLALGAEIDAILASRGATPIGVAVNWGRSAIEARDPGVPELHIRQARQRGVLNGVMFSGATLDDPLYGKWADRHAPFAASAAEAEQRPLTAARARACLEAVKGHPLAFLGFKIQTLPKSLAVGERVAELQRTAQVLDEVGGA